MKVNINKLPQGFDIVDGKVIESKSHGGMHTGDQYNYHLVTNTDTHWHNGNGDIEDEYGNCLLEFNTID